MITAKQMTAHAIWTQCGLNTFGGTWTIPVATTLGVSDRSVRNWAAEGKDISERHAQFLIEAMMDRVSEIMSDLDACSAMMMSDGHARFDQHNQGN